MTPTHAEDLGRARTAADFAAIRALLDTDLNNAIARKQELQQAEDRAIFGEGDLAAARAALDDCNDAIALVERTIEAVDKRRIAVARSEARVDIEALGAEIRTKAASLGERWKSVHELIEQLRQKLFAADALSRAIIAANAISMPTAPSA
ncbi:hypothetical protein NKH10_22550 [Mesorhizobium sp. M1340]|uniref:hypothetical protein n=1 Tax=Mesorhizobium sp. M1340 TaxID=2957087 RepID=UPI003334CAE5